MRGSVATVGGQTKARRRFSNRLQLERWQMAIAALHNLEIHQMDVKTTFLNGELNEEIYMKQSKGFIVPSQEKKVCRLVKSF